MSEVNSNNKRIAKNTIYLYFRTFLVLIVTLYTSRVILKELGVEDYGIYNVVGGTIAMLGILTNALSVSISRFITIEIGRKKTESLVLVFSTSLKILLILSLIVFILGETIGTWFLNIYLNIPENRLNSANWVWHCAVLTFIINLISVPYYACIIAHEHMNVYAIISVFEVLMKLCLVFLLKIILIDKLILFSILMLFVTLFIRIAYIIYCRHNFYECRIITQNNKKLINDITSFTSYSFVGQLPNILNTQGLNILINIFFGVTVNAARGIAHQVEAAIVSFVSNFMVAIKPQITKSYAQDDTNRMFQLICYGSKYSYFLMLFFSIPVIIETDYILKLWLGEYPSYTIVFLRLSIICHLISMLGETGYTAIQASGNIKYYTKIITLIALAPLPTTFIAFKLGGNVCYAYYTYLVTYILVNIVRLYFMKKILEFPPILFVKNVIFKIINVTIVAFILPITLYYQINDNFIRFLCVSVSGFFSIIIVIWLLGMEKCERNIIVTYIKNKIFK